MIKIILISLIIFFVINNSCNAQINKVDSNFIIMENLDVVTVSAERFPTNEKYVPRFITISSREELKQTGANNVIDGLKRIGGLTYKSLGPLGITQGGMNSEVAIRGIQGGELILINGVNVQAASSRAYDLNLIAIDQIEKIEVVKGAASAIYGSNAMSGIINIITKRNIFQSKLKLGIEGGSFDYYKTLLSGNYKNLSLSFEYQTIGRIENVAINYSKNYRYNHDPAKKYNYSFNFNCLESFYFDYMGTYNTITYEKVYDDPSQKKKGTHQIQNKNFANIRYEVKNLRAKVYTNFDMLASDIYTAPKTEDTRNKTYTYGTDLDYKFKLADYSFQAGISSAYRAADYNLKYGHKYDIHSAVFLQVKKSLLNNLNVSVGVREQYINGGSQNKDYHVFLPSFGVNYTFNNFLNSYVSFGKAFRTPTFNNLYYKSDLFEGNNNLKPEIGYTYEAGIKLDDDYLTLRLAAFYMDYQDKIELDREGEIQRYVNAGEYKSSGIEWNVDFSTYNILHIPFIITTSGFYAEPVAKVEEVKEQMGPKVQFNFGVKYYEESCTVEINSVMTAVRERNLNNCHTLNFYASYKFWKGKVIMAVDNILDRENQTFGNMKSEIPSRYSYFDLGRQLKLGYQLTI